MRFGDSANTPPWEPQMYPGFGYGCAHCGQLGSGIAYSPVMSPTPPFVETGSFLCCSDARGLSTSNPKTTTSQAANERGRRRMRTFLPALLAVKVYSS